MKAPIDLMNSVSKKRIDPLRPHKGIVVDDNDPEMRARVQIRVPILFDGIKDEDLPWAIPETNGHGRGLMGGGPGKRSATLLGIPKKGNWVNVYFRHNGDPNLASYSHDVPFDNKTFPEEFETNYPNRLGQVMPSGFFWVLDESTGELFVNVPGDYHMTVFGDLRQTVVGNHQIHVAKSEAAVPDYLKDSVSSILSSLTSNQKGRVPFKGLGDKSKGNLHLEVEGDFTAKIGGKVEWRVAKNWKSIVTGNMDYAVSGSVTINGVKINLN